jgi:hypothetical protein
MQKTAGGRLTEWTAWCSRHIGNDIGDQSNILTRAMELLVVNIRSSMAMMSRVEVICIAGIDGRPYLASHAPPYTFTAWVPATINPTS